MRLNQSADYDYVFSAPEQRSSDRYFIVLGRFHSQENISQARLGLVIAKKKIAKAHERNRVKRIIRESFRRSSHGKRMNILVLAKPSVEKATNQELFTSLQKHWQRICRHSVSL